MIFWNTGQFMIQNKLNARCEYILLPKSLPQEYLINITLWIGDQNDLG